MNATRPSHRSRISSSEITSPVLRHNQDHVSSGSTMMAQSQDIAIAELRRGRNHVRVGIAMLTLLAVAAIPLVLFVK